MSATQIAVRVGASVGCQYCLPGAGVKAEPSEWLLEGSGGSPPGHICRRCGTGYYADTLRGVGFLLGRLSMGDAPGDAVATAAARGFWGCRVVEKSQTGGRHGE